MKKSATLFLFFSISLIIIGISGCKGKKYVVGKYTEVTEISEGKALVYIYRPSKFTGSAVHYTINVDGEKVSRVHLYNGGYFEYYAEPGKRNFWLELSGKRQDIIVNCEEGETYFVKVKVGEFFRIPNTIGKEEIKKCNKLKIE